MSQRPAAGLVSLVGAGPGDPDMLTRKAVRRLSEADLVVYDALVDPEALAFAPAARRVFVGKRAGRPAVRQEFINGLLVWAGRRGQRVVRLKGGDPFVFGRGGEEALALTAAGVPIEVVPGISSAIGAAALAGIPVTHRGLATGFVVVSGHAEGAYRLMLESLAPNCATVVIMMGLAHRAAIAALLTGRGWKPDTPAAILLSASTARAAAYTTTLAELARGGVDLSEHDGAGTVVIGDVVRLGAVLGRATWPPVNDRPAEGSPAAPSRRAAASGAGA